MTNWKTYKIIDKNINEDFISLSLDGEVDYAEGFKMNCCFCKKCSPFTDWCAGEYVEIDNDITRYKVVGCNLTLTNTSEIRRISMDLVRFQTENSSLQSRNSGLQRERDNYQSLVRAGERELNTKNEQIREKDRQITTYSTQLTAAQSQLTTTRNDLVAKQNQYDELTRQFTALQITINNKDNEIKEKVDKIKELKGELNLSQEEFLNQKIGLKDEKLETFIQTLGINREEITNLRSAYEQLIIARRDYVQANIVEARNNINAIRGRILNGGVSVANTQKVCRKCEKLVKLELELNQIYQEQYEARQQVPPHNQN